MLLTNEFYLLKVIVNLYSPKIFTYFYRFSIYFYIHVIYFSSPSFPYHGIWSPLIWTFFLFPLHIFRRNIRRCWFILEILVGKPLYPKMNNLWLYSRGMVLLLVPKYLFFKVFSWLGPKKCLTSIMQ